MSACKRSLTRYTMFINTYRHHERVATSIGLSVPEMKSELSSVYIDTLPVVKMGTG